MIIKRLLEARSNEEVSDLTNPAEWLTNFFGGGASSFAGERVTTDTAILNSNVYTCASILGGDIGKLPIQMFEQKGNQLCQNSLHPASVLLGERANPYMSAFTFKETVQVHMVVWGNAYVNIEWDLWGYPKALWPLDPGKTEIRIDKGTGELWYVTTLPTGERRKLSSDEVIHLKMLSRTGLKGITPIEVIREDIGMQQASKKFLGAFYKNGTSTKGILKTTSALQPDAKNIVREEWGKLNSGLDNAHRIAILDAGMDFQNISMPLQDAQFIETQKWGILEIAKIYKIPPHKLGQMDRATFSNIEHQSLEYLKNTLMPFFVNWEQELNYKLLTDTERKTFYFKFNVTSELRGDSKSRAEYYEKMVHLGAYNLNDVRALEEMDSIGELGNRHFVSLNYTTLEMLEAYQMAKAKLGEKGADSTSENGNDSSKSDGSPQA